MTHVERNDEKYDEYGEECDKYGEEYDKYGEEYDDEYHDEYEEYEKYGEKYNKLQVNMIIFEVKNNEAIIFIQNISLGNTLLRPSQQ